MNLSTMLKSGIKVVTKYSPQILTGLGIAEFITAVIFAVEATPGAYNKIKTEEYKRYTDGDEREITVKEIVAMTWKDYIPSATMALIGSAMIITGQYAQTKRTIAMTAAYTMMAEQANRTYERAKELVGKQKAEDIRAKVAQDMIDDIPEEKFTQAKDCGGDDYFCDALSGQVFKHDIRKIEKAVNDYNKDLMIEMWKSVNDLYELIGIDHTIMAEILGYDIDKGFFEFKKPYVAEKNGKAVFVLVPQNYPVPRERL